MIGRRGFVGGALAAGVLGTRAMPAAKSAATALYDRAIVIDSLGGFEPDEPLSAATLADIRASGVTAVNLTVSAVGNIPDSFEATVRQTAATLHNIAAHPDVLMQVRSAAELRAAKASSRCGVILGFQDSMPLGPNLERLPMFDDLGLRICQPTYNRRNLAGDGSIEAANGGLSRLGFDLIAALNERRIVADFSHAGQRTIAEGIAASKRPPAITHTGCRDLMDHPRNVWDRELKALADKGGVAGIYFMPYLAPKGQATGADLIRHIEHAWSVAGEDHVGLGTDGTIPAVAVTEKYRKDFTAITAARRKAGIAAPGETDDAYTFIAAYNTPRRFETLAADLLARGHATARVEKLIGGNFARLFSEVWG